MKKVVTFGEILLRFSSDAGERLFQAPQINTHFGGAEANVAVSLSRFGHDVYYVSKVPNNPLGLEVEKHLRSHGVQTNFIKSGGERLGTYYVEAGVGLRSAQVTYDRKYSSISELALEELDFAEILEGVSLYHVSGITAALAPTLREVVLHSLQKAKELGVTTSFDFNYRAKLWSHQEAAEAIKLYLPYVDICSCGEMDALYLLGIKQAEDSLEPSEKLKYYYDQIQEKYPTIRWFSSTFRGVESASSNTLQGNVYHQGELSQSRVYRIDHIIDRVGGGDAFAAGILHGILERWNPEEIAAFATAASVLKHTVHGDCNLFSEAEIQQFASSAPGRIVR